MDNLELAEDLPAGQERHRYRIGACTLDVDRRRT